MNFIHSIRYFLPVGIFLLFLFFSLSSRAQQLNDKGRIIGTARNDRNEPLSSATITIKPGNKTVKANISGEFEIDLTPGIYILTISYAGLETKQITDVVIKKGEVTKQDVSLNVKSSGEVVVTASAKKETINAGLRLQKNNTAVSDVLSSEQMRRTPDNNIGDALRRANGVTVVENKFVVIRGMGDRYNNVMVNGSVMPSTEPGKKNFSFDIIPTAMVENIVINKTATPDLPTDFAGGLVQVTTKDVPDKNTLSIGVGTGFNSVSTGKEMINTGIAKSEYFGILDSRRKWFWRDWDPVEYDKVANAASLSQRNIMNSKIPNLWQAKIYTAQPVQDYQFTLGLRKKFKSGNSLGALLGGTYRNQQLIESYAYEGENSSLDSTNGKKYTFSTNIGALFSLAYNFKKSRISFKNIYVRRLTNEMFFYGGVTDQTYNVKDSYASRIQVSDLLQNRFEGEHNLNNKLKIKWFFDRILTVREFPDSRLVAFTNSDISSGNYFVELSNKGTNSLGGIYYSKLNEDKLGGGLDITYTYRLLGEEQKLKFGYLGGFRNAKYNELFIRPTREESKDLSATRFLAGKAYYDVYAPENFRNGLLYYYPIISDKRVGIPLDGYKGVQNTNAGYAMTDAKITDKLRIIAGVRIEDFLIRSIAAGNRVVPNPNVPGTSMTIKIDSTYQLKELGFFPSANFVYQVTGKSNLRLAVTKTSARVDFREIYPSNIYDFELLADVRGAALKNATIINSDLRYELFPNPGEVLSVTAFYKKFTNPIEPFVISLSGGDFLFTNVNLSSSVNTGVEFDMRKSLSFLYKKSKLLKNLYFSGNASVMNSSVNIDPNLVNVQLGGAPSNNPDFKRSRKRPLSGLSPYSLNAGLLYQGNKFGANIVYNRFGKRIVTASMNAEYDRYEKPRDIVDLQVYTRLLKNKVEFKFNVSNLLNQKFIIYNNGGQGGISGIPKGAANNDPKGTDYNEDLDLKIYEGNRGTNYSLSLNFLIF